MTTPNGFVPAVPQPMPYGTQIIPIATNDCWIRDYGPSFVRNPADGSIHGVNWRYNAWGGKYQPHDQDAPSALPGEGVHHGLQHDVGHVHEGGDRHHVAREAHGQGEAPGPHGPQHGLGDAKDTPRGLEHLSEEEILELTYVTLTYELHATMCRALRLEYDDVDERDRRFTTGERTPEGFYVTRAGMEQAISRGLAYAPNDIDRNHGRTHSGRGLDDGADFLLRELSRVDGVEPRGATPTPHDLDLSGPVTKVEAGGLQDLRYAVGNATESGRIGCMYSANAVAANAMAPER